MSIKQAFNILSQTLGKNFQFKNDFDSFASHVMTTQSISKEFSNYMLERYPNAKYIYFGADYDSINLKNRTGNYEIVSADNTILDTDDTLKESDFEIHSDILLFIYREFVYDLYFEESDAAEEFRFNLQTLECLPLEDYEKDEEYIAKLEKNE